MRRKSNVTLEQEKKRYKKVAAQLLYSKTIQERIENATSVGEILRLMKVGRNEMVA